MGIKLVGGAVLAIAGIIMALSRRRYEWRKLQTLDGFISFLFYVKGQIDCYARPRSEIFKAMPAEIFCSCNCPQGAEGMEEMLEASKIYLDDEPQRLLAAFASEFGSTFRDEQLRRCDYYISALGEQRRKVFGEARAKGRAGSALWICASLGIIILFW